MSTIHLNDKYYMVHLWCKEMHLEPLYVPFERKFCVIVHLLEDTVNFFGNYMIIVMGYMGYW